METWREITKHRLWGSLKFWFLLATLAALFGVFFTWIFWVASALSPWTLALSLGMAFLLAGTGTVTYVRMQIEADKTLDQYPRLKLQGIDDAAIYKRPMDHTDLLDASNRLLKALEKPLSCDHCFHANDASTCRNCLSAAVNKYKEIDAIMSEPWSGDLDVEEFRYRRIRIIIDSCASYER